MPRIITSVFRMRLSEQGRMRMVKPYIYVDITLLEQTASAISEYIKDYDRNFGEMNATMRSLSSSWVSNDYIRFIQQWNLFYRGKSIGVSMHTEFSNYQEYLSYAAQQYKKCQSNAMDRANRLK